MNDEIFNSKQFDGPDIEFNDQLSNLGKNAKDALIAAAVEDMVVMQTKADTSKTSAGKRLYTKKVSKMRKRLIQLLDVM